PALGSWSCPTSATCRNSRPLIDSEPPCSNFSAPPADRSCCSEVSWPPNVRLIVLVESPCCHPEERSDEGSASERDQRGQILRFAQDDKGEAIAGEAREDTTKSTLSASEDIRRRP